MYHKIIYHITYATKSDVLYEYTDINCHHIIYIKQTQQRSEIEWVNQSTV